MNTLRRSSRAFLVLSLLAALGGTAAASQFPDFITSKPNILAGFSRYDPASVTLQSIGYPPVTWTIVGGALPSGLGLSSNGIVSGTPTAPGAFTVTFKAIDSEGRWGTRSYDGFVYAVPKPKPIDIPYTLGAFYMPKPSWPGHQWADLRLLNEKNAIKTDSFGQRMPLMGYYQGDSVEVLDWQIKMAVDRGITHWTFHDYWVDGASKPVYETGLGAFLNARYRRHMTFAVDYNQCLVPVRDIPSTRACFIEKVIPYYVDHYFNQSNYLHIGGRPVVVIGSPWYAFAMGYGPASLPVIADILAEADAYIQEKTGAPGAYWITTDMGIDADQSVNFAFAQAAGFDAVAAGYVLPSLWPPAAFPITIMTGCGSPLPPGCGNGPFPPGVSHQTAMNHAVQQHKLSFIAAQQSGLKFLTAPQPDFDFRWQFWWPQQIYFDGQNQAGYTAMLAQVRTLVDQNVGHLPVSGATGKPMVGVGPWNEWGESSTLEPGRSVFQRPANGNGDPYFMATALAQAFGGPATFDAYPPGDHGQGFPVKSDWTFPSANPAALAEWSSSASADLALGAGDVMVVTAPTFAPVGTPTSVAASAFQRVKVLMRVDAGAPRLKWLTLNAQGSTYTNDAHNFDTPTEPGGRFNNLLLSELVCHDDCVTDPQGFQLYTFQVAGNPEWTGTVRYLVLRFQPCGFDPNDPCAPGVPQTTMKVAIKRVWME